MNVLTRKPPPFGSPRIIAVGGGKGGIGKSFVSANLAVRLACLGFRVAAVDLDFGAQNLHNFLGLPTPTRCLSEFFQGQISCLEDVAAPSFLNNLSVYSCNENFWLHLPDHAPEKLILIKQFQKMPYDFVILDLGAGTHVHTLDFLLFADGGVIVMTPEPTSIENAYVFMKSALLRKLQHICRYLAISEADQSMLFHSLKVLSHNETPLDVLEHFAQNCPEAEEKFLPLLNNSQLSIVMNQVRTQADTALGPSMSTVCSRYFGFSSQYLGAMRYDDMVWKSIRTQRPLIIDHPQSIVSVNVYQIAEALINSYRNQTPLHEFSRVSFDLSAQTNL